MTRSASHNNHPFHPLKPASLRNVTITDQFWASKLQHNREISLPAIYKQCQESGRIDAWRLQWQPGMPEPHIFWDSDVAKWLEAAAYCLTTHPDPKLEAQVDVVIALIASAQQPDGYLNTHFTSVNPDKRWQNLRDWHELYCAGHLIEAAVAYFEATGKRQLLDVMCRYADLIDRLFGYGDEKKRGFPGHEEIELALVKLARVTGERRYLELAKFFIDARGNHGDGEHYYDLEARARGEDPADYWAKTHAYTQSHIPVRQQREPVGHAVRGAYLYCAMADIAALYKDEALLVACRSIWQHLVGRRMYITGGVGPSRANEGHTSDYDLPNDTAYAETCAAIGLVFWSHRLLQIEADARYADVIEQALYNGVLSGVALGGGRFFYENPLASRGQHQRWEWYHCVCCPPNLVRLLASLGQYLYSQDDESIYVHLFASSRASIEIAGKSVNISQQTKYPWDENVTITVENPGQAEFSICVRMPTWCRTPRATLNGSEVYPGAKLEKGYLRLKRRWSPDDQLMLHFPMPVERVEAHPEVRANCGRVALQRGPVIYCLEAADNDGNLYDLLLSTDAELKARYEPGLLEGVVVLTGTAQRRSSSGWQEQLYRHDRSSTETAPIQAIPYFAWANRKPGEMLVWLRTA